MHQLRETTDTNHKLQSVQQSTGLKESGQSEHTIPYLKYKFNYR